MIQNHPGFGDVSIDHDLLLRLPDDSSVLDEIDSAGITEDVANIPEGSQGADGGDGVERLDDIVEPTTAAVPDTRAQNLEVEELRRGKLSFPSPTHV